MAFEFPKYHAPDFNEEKFRNAPDAKWAAAELDGVAPEGYHSTSMYPEYFKLNGQWRLAEESRMDSSVVLREDGTLSVVENRNLKKGDRVILGRHLHALPRLRGAGRGAGGSVCVPSGTQPRDLLCQGL